MVTVWGRPDSVNVQKVMWTIGELGLDHERRDVGGAFGGLETPDYGRLNPNRRIPTLVDDDGTVVWESNTVVRYLAARYGAGTLWPEEVAARARADMWMDWALGSVMPDLIPVFWQLIRTAPENRDPDRIVEGAGRLARIWPILDDHLADHAHVAGDQLTMGDVPVGALFYRYSELDIERPELPNLARWYAALRERPAYRAHVMLPLT